MTIKLLHCIAMKTFNLHGLPSCSSFSFSGTWFSTKKKFMVKSTYKKLLILTKIHSLNMSD